MLRKQVKTFFRTLVVSAIVIGLAGAGSVWGADQSDGSPASETFPKYVKLAQSQVTQTIKIGVSKAVVIELPNAVSDILVSDPGVADALLRTSTRAYVIGNEIGQANIFFFDAQGRQIANVDLYVQNDIGELERQLQRLIPGSEIEVEIINNNILLIGTVRTPLDSQRAADMAGRFIGTKADRVREQNRDQQGASGDINLLFRPDGDGTSEDNYSQVLNLLTVNASDQVMLKVLIAEMRRDVIKQLGVDLQGSFGAATVLRSATPHPVNKAFQSLNQLQTGGSDFSANLRAFEQAGLAKLLAEPVLTAVSGETAKFLVGGEMALPTEVGVNEFSDRAAVRTELKPIGVSLTFTPVVLSSGRINLRVNTEVTNITEANKSVVASRGGYGHYSIPTIRVRRASTTVELPSGGSMAIAGLIEEEVRQAMSGMPVLRKLPIIGALFRSRDYLRAETELAIIVTPYTVKPATRSEFTDPTQGFVEASDSEAIFMGRLNRVYGLRQVQGNYSGRIGYVYK